MIDVSNYAIIITNVKRLHCKNDKLEILSVSIFEIEKQPYSRAIFAFMELYI